MRPDPVSLDLGPATVVPTGLGPRSDTSSGLGATGGGSDSGEGTGSRGAPIQAPGAPGVAVSPRDALLFLQQLSDWLDARSADLTALDTAPDTAGSALTASQATAVTMDLAVAWTFWKAVSDRMLALRTTADGGRMLEKEGLAFSSLIWGRMDAGAPGTASGSPLAVSLPEVCRLCDALTGSLRARLALDADEAKSGERLKALRQSTERVRDQLGQVPAGIERESARSTLAALQDRLVATTDKFRRGADVGGLLGPLEIETATLERDLIVAAAQSAARDRARHEAGQTRLALAARRDAVRTLARQCVARVDPAPRRAVPDVMALGEIPDDDAGFAAYGQRLGQVAQALDQAQAAYTTALAEWDELTGRADALTAQGRALNPSPQMRSDLDELKVRIDAVAALRPSPMPRLRALVAALAGYAKGMS